VGSLIPHEITAHRIEQYKRERSAGKWRGHGYTGTAKPIRPATVNRELDTLRSIFSKAVEWGKLLDHPMRNVKRLKVDNPRTRILTEDDQARLLTASPRKLDGDAGADHRREVPRAARPPLGSLPGRPYDLSRDQERQGQAHPDLAGDRGRAGRPATPLPWVF